MEVFGWFEIPSAISLGESQIDFVGEVHEIASLVLILLVGLHVIAVLKHHFLYKDDITLVRMLKP